MSDTTMEKIVSLCKRRGFIFQSSEIYGGLTGAWDYGPLGVELKNNIRDFWWKEMTQLHDNIVGLDASILMHPNVWVASGHVSNFTDPMVDCRQCKSRFRADQIDLTAPCPVCGGKGDIHGTEELQPDVRDPHGLGSRTIPLSSTSDPRLPRVFTQTSRMSFSQAE